MKDTTYGRLLTFLSQLEDGAIVYKLDHVRDGAIMVEVTVPGER